MATKRRSSPKKTMVSGLNKKELEGIVAVYKLRPKNKSLEGLRTHVAKNLTADQIKSVLLTGKKLEKKSPGRKKSTNGRKKSAGRKKSTNGRKKSAGRKKSPKSKEAMLNRLKLEQLKQLASKNNVCPRLTKEQKAAGKKKVTKENYVRALKNKMTKKQLEAALRPARRQSAPRKM